MSEASDSTISPMESSFTWAASSFTWAASIRRSWLRNLERIFGIEMGMVFMRIES